MISNVTTPTLANLCDSEIHTIGKLLLNSWSAEYALRLTPATVKEPECAQDSLNWTFPQAYYAAFFSARAVLATDRLMVANQEGVNTLMNGRAGAGFYGPSLTTETNPYSALMVYQLGPELPKVRVTGDEALALNRRLVDSVHAVALIHETYVLQRIGQNAYHSLIMGLPAYLRDGFVGMRALFITSDD